MPPKPTVRQERPRKPHTQVFTLGNDDWREVNYNFSKCSVWRLCNRGAQIVRYGYRENCDPDYLELDPGDDITYVTQPGAVWLQRSNALTNPVIRFEGWSWEED